MTAVATEFLRDSQSSAAQTTCAHCGLAVPAGLIDENAIVQFCCSGCEAVFKTLHSCGLDAYYRLRELDDAAPRPANPTNKSFASFDSPTFHRLYVQERAGGLLSADLALEGVSCAACIWLLEKLPRLLSGVVEARLSLREATVRVIWDPAQISLSQIAQALDGLGYTPHPARSELGREAQRREVRRRLIHLGVAGAIMGNGMLLALALYAGSFGHMEAQFRTFFRWLSAGLAAISLAWPGATFFKSAWAAVRMRTTNLDVPIAFALVVGGIAGLVNVVLNRGEIYFDSLCVLIFLLLVGRFIQFRQQRWADDAVGLLFNLTPSSCRRVDGDQAIEVPIEAVQPGDQVEVRPGELFPVDGRVTRGCSSSSQALLTGESMPVAIDVGSPVHAGAQNVDSVVRVRVDRIGRDTRVGRLMTLVEEGIREKPAIVEFSDRIGKWFVVAITCAAAATFLFWCRRSVPLAIDHTVALLIVTCPCVLGLATPLTIAMALGRLARRDILVKSGVALERLSEGGSLLLDKTGTLTEGRLGLLGWYGESSVRPIVAAAEAKSNHPVGRALREGIDGPAESNEISNIVERGDGGISARWGSRQLHIGSPVYAARNSVVLSEDFDSHIRCCENEGLTTIVISIDRFAVAVAKLGDVLRPDSASAIQELRRLGFAPEILSGDARPVVEKVAANVGIHGDKAFGQLTPEQKLFRVRDRSNGLTIMVGDGVNDAAALAAADVGIAVHGGAEASLAAADVYIARHGLQPLVELVRMSRQTMSVVRRNLAISLGYNVLAGGFAAAGWMTPMVAAILMPVSSATVLGLAATSITHFARANGKGSK